MKKAISARVYVPKNNTVFFEEKLMDYFIQHFASIKDEAEFLLSRTHNIWVFDDSERRNYSTGEHPCLRYARHMLACAEDGTISEKRHLFGTLDELYKTAAYIEAATERGDWDSASKNWWTAKETAPEEELDENKILLAQIFGRKTGFCA